MSKEYSTPVKGRKDAAFRKKTRTASVKMFFSQIGTGILLTGFVSQKYASALFPLAQNELKEIHNLLAFFICQI